MSPNISSDDLSAVVHYALDPTRATTVCPFHDDVVIRVGDYAAESHALDRAKRIVKRDGTNWETPALREELGRQLALAADGRCPKCDSTS